jgi:hypothetical protein
MVRAPVAVIAAISASSPIPAQLTAFAAWAPLAISTIPFSRTLSKCDRAAIIIGVSNVSPYSSNFVEGITASICLISTNKESKYSLVIWFESHGLLCSISFILNAPFYLCMYSLTFYPTFAKFSFHIKEFQHINVHVGNFMNGSFEFEYL